MQRACRKRPPVAPIIAHKEREDRMGFRKDKDTRETVEIRIDLPVDLHKIAKKLARQDRRPLNHWVRALVLREVQRADPRDDPDSPEFVPPGLRDL